MRIGLRESTLHTFLSRDWAGLAIAGVVGLVGLLVFQAAGHWATGLLGVALLLAAGLLGAGALYHLYRVWRAARRHPAPGRMLDVGGFRMHILAEGEAGGRAPVIWVTGGHGQGLLMHHLHRRIRDETRSILFDRAGSGWSDAGPFPLSVTREVDDLARLLDAAGETGPFLLVGNSFGGLFCSNFAHCHPDRVAGVLLLDATPPWNMTYAREVTFDPLRTAARKAGLACLFGLGWRQHALDREADELELTDELAGMQDEIRLEYARPRTHWSTSSALLTAAHSPFDLVVGEGALGDIPLRFIGADTDREELQRHLEAELGFSERQIGNLLDGLALSAFEHLRLSSQSELAHAPEGTGHMFPYEVPDFTIEHVREMLNRIDESHQNPPDSENLP